MIDVTVTAERAQTLLDHGIKMVAAPDTSEPVFMFTGPGLLMARLAYDDTVFPESLDWRGPDGQSIWDIVILRLEATRPARTRRAGWPKPEPVDAEVVDVPPAPAAAYVAHDGATCTDPGHAMGHAIAEAEQRRAEREAAAAQGAEAASGGDRVSPAEAMTPDIPESLR